MITYQRCTHSVVVVKVADVCFMGIIRYTSRFTDPEESVNACWLYSDDNVSNMQLVLLITFFIILHLFGALYVFNWSIQLSVIGRI